MTSVRSSALVLESDLPTAALELARVFSAGGRLVVTAPGRADHARHVAVEFIHPAVAGAKSLPALAVDPHETSSVLPTDALLVLDSDDDPFAQPLPRCRLAMVTRSDQRGPELVRWYHLLWELVQLGLEHPGLTGGAASVGGDPTSFLYPFLDAAEHDEPALLASMSASIDAKRLESETLCRQTVAANASVLDEVARVIRTCGSESGTVFAIGNGGSSCDAGRLVRLLRELNLRAASLAEDSAVLTALANDLGASHIFARQVEASVRPGDVLMAFSTSGASANLLAAATAATASHATVVTCTGYGGGPLADHAAVDLALVIDASSVHRIQEAQGTLVDDLCNRVRSPRVDP